MTDIEAAAPASPADEAGERCLPQQDSGALWQPYVDPPLLTPQMVLGLDEASPVERQRLLRYLAALVATRRAPVHVNVAFNAVYFGFDLTTRSYVGGALNDMFSFPEVRVEECSDALPVGALVNIATGVHPLFAEVVYKEGAHPLLRDEGSLPVWVSGAPAGATGPGQVGESQAAQESGEPVLRERLVIDVDAFGAGLSLTAQQLQRMQTRGRGLDADGHVLLDARYASRADSDLDEVSFYARYLLKRGRDQLLSASAPLPLGTLLIDNACDERYEEALIGLLRTVAEALESLPELRIWRGYAFTRASLGVRLRDPGPLGGSDLGTIAVQLGHSAVPSRPSRWGPTRKVAYTAIGPRLRGVRGSGAALKGLGYSQAVCHANAVVSDYVRGDADEVTGLLPDEVSLRLDDPWQGGGVWRAECPGSAYARGDVTQPLGLGWRSSLPVQTPFSVDGEVRSEAESTEEPALEPKPVLVDDDEATVLAVTDSQISWSQPLRLSHQLDGRLPLPEPVVAKMRMTGSAPKLRLLLAHDGYELDRSQAQQDTDTELYGPRPQLGGIDWPLEFFPGIVLTCTWPRGGSVVRATSTLLDAPVTVDGMEIEHRYDASILTRDAAPGEARRSAGRITGGSTGPIGTLTLAQRVLRAVRRLGLLDPDGRAVLARSSLTAAVYGTAGLDVATRQPANADAALSEVIDQLVSDGDLTLEVAGVDTARHLRFPTVPGLQQVEVIVYTPAVLIGLSQSARIPAQRRLDPRFLRTTEVGGHLRFIAHLGWEPSEAARAAYREGMRRFGLIGPAELPPGYTYVSPFIRGG